MRISPYLAFLVALVVFFSKPGAAMAQDAGMSDVDIVDERDQIDNERLLSSPGGEGEVRYIPKTTSARKDTVALQVLHNTAAKPAARPAEKQPAKEDDSILTFNFLYYIIQKYKLQDIVD